MPHRAHLFHGIIQINIQRFCKSSWSRSAFLPGVLPIAVNEAPVEPLSLAAPDFIHMKHRFKNFVYFKKILEWQNGKKKKKSAQSSWMPFPTSPMLRSHKIILQLSKPGA